MLEQANFCLILWKNNFSYVIIAKDKCLGRVLDNNQRLI